MLQAAGFKIFLPDGRPPPASLASWSTAGMLEFMLSSHDRLAAYPVQGGRPALHDGAARSVQRPRAVFVLDLIQDFEILRPFLLLAAAPDSPIEACAAITERVLTSHLATEITTLLRQLGIPWFKPVGVADVAAALGDRRAVLLTAAESSAPGHAFGHACCRVAPPRTLRATFQHGYECVGLRHHRAHDLQFPQGVRFASDVIFTWRSPDELGDLCGADRRRALPVGVTKATAQRAARLLQRAWDDVTPTLPGQAALPSAQALVIAENLHSVRFASPLRYQRYLRFIDDMVARTDVRTVIRSHPGKRTLEKTRAGKTYAFLEDVLTADHFMASRGPGEPTVDHPPRRGPVRPAHRGLERCGRAGRRAELPWPAHRHRRRRCRCGDARSRRRLRSAGPAMGGREHVGARWRARRLATSVHPDRMNAPAEPAASLDNGFNLVRRVGPARFRKVLATGVGRSGTTAVAAIFHSLGFHLGDAPVTHLHEDVAFRRLLLEGDPAALAGALQAWSNRHAAVAWKDPKIYAAASGSFMDLLPDDWLVIGVFRDPLAVAQRRAYSDGTELLPTAHAVARFQMKLLGFLQSVRHTVGLVSYERFIVDPEPTLASLLALLEAPRPPSSLSSLRAEVLSQRDIYRQNTIPHPTERAAS